MFLLLLIAILKTALKTIQELQPVQKCSDLPINGNIPILSHNVCPAALVASVFLDAIQSADDTYMVWDLLN